MTHVGILFCLYDHLKQLKEENIMAYMSEEGYKKLMAELKELETIPDLVFENNMLKENGLFVLEHGKKNNFEDNPHFIERRVYGSVNFSFFR